MEESKQYTERLLAELPAHSLVCFTDGACKGNPGPCGAGVTLFYSVDGGVSQEPVVEMYRYLGQGTNNIAELTAIEMALDIVKQLETQCKKTWNKTIILTDSKYCEGMFTKGWEAKANLELIQKIQMQLEHRHDIEICWIPGHISTPGNERADALANKALKEKDEWTSRGNGMKIL